MRAARINANGSRCVCSQAGLWIALAKGGASLLSHILAVALGRPEKKMGRVYALRIVALVADEHIADWADKRFVGNSVRFCAAAPTNADPAITFFIQAALPLPTVTNTFNVVLDATPKRTEPLPLLRGSRSTNSAWLARGHPNNPSRPPSPAPIPAPSGPNIEPSWPPVAAAPSAPIARFPPCPPVVVCVWLEKSGRPFIIEA